eukprot:TRINITY_DN2915_c0_g1_i1.p1 TRINITY_DN2915_c0_g1~~TRINITY_DN2915_c0_g1_i1.p1  ORF type:complete len:880 (-),score=169.88 TRINITY_DN2915_c0_g1_i1:2382-5021(-)
MELQNVTAGNPSAYQESANNGACSTVCAETDIKYDYMVKFHQSIESNYSLVNDDGIREFLSALKSIGLNLDFFYSGDGKQIFMGIKVPDHVLYAEAEKMKLPVRDKHYGAYVEFKKSDIDLYEKVNSQVFRQTVRSHVALNLMKKAVVKINQTQHDDDSDWDPKNDLKSYAQGKFDYFPLHSETAIKSLMEEWGKRFWKQQPITMIRYYFGEQIAMYFAFLGFYTTWLISASVFGIIVFALSEDEGFDHPIVPFYCIFLSLWSTFFYEFWKRNSKRLANEWGTLGFKAEEQTRPEYKGVLQDGVFKRGTWVDFQKHGLKGRPGKNYYSNDKKFEERYLISPSILLFMVCVVLAATLGLMIVRTILQREAVTPFWGGQLAGVINAICIVILNAVYRRVAWYLNNMENYRTVSEYENNLIAKTFIFQFVNSYISLFYIAFIKETGNIGDDECKESCMKDLTSQVSSILIFRHVLGQFQEVLLPWVITRFNIIRRYIVKRDDDEIHLNEYDKQSVHPSYESTFDDYNEMIIQYGYVTLFAAAFPLAPAIALFNNLIEIRTDAIRLLKGQRRPDYQAAEDIGTWGYIIEVIGVAAVITNSLIISQTSEQLSDLMDEDNGKRVLFVAVGIEHGILLLKYIFSILIPDTPYEVKESLAKQDYLKDHGLEFHGSTREGKTFRKPNQIEATEIHIRHLDGNPYSAVPSKIDDHLPPQVQPVAQAYSVPQVIQAHPSEQQIYYEPPQQYHVSPVALHESQSAHIPYHAPTAELPQEQPSVQQTPAQEAPVQPYVQPAPVQPYVQPAPVQPYIQPAPVQPYVQPALAQQSYRTTVGPTSPSASGSIGRYSIPVTYGNVYPPNYHSQHLSPYLPQPPIGSHLGQSLPRFY